MDTSHHHLSALFAELGLPAEPDAIRRFIASHPLPGELKIYQASFWNDSQRDFLQTALEEDADWSDTVEQLAVMLSR
jgi:hypothetical protein